MYLIFVLSINNLEEVCKPPEKPLYPDEAYLDTFGIIRSQVSDILDQGSKIAELLNRAAKASAARWNFRGGPRHKIKAKKLIGISWSFNLKVSPEIDLISSKQLILSTYNHF